MTKPTRDEVATAVAGAIGPHGHLVRCVAVHGSWVRGDLLDGQSDLDLIVIGRGVLPHRLRDRRERLPPRPSESTSMQ